MDETNQNPVSKPLIIIPRAEWDGPFIDDPRDPDDPWEYNPKKVLLPPVTDVILSYTGTKNCYTTEECKKAMLNMYNEYQAKGIYDVPYNFVVGGDGNVYEGRGWKRRPEINDEFPELDGEFMEISHFGEKGGPPPLEQANASYDLILKGVQLKHLECMPERHTQYYY